MSHSKDLSTYCNNTDCPASGFCRRFTRRADDEMPTGTVVMKFQVVPGGLHCGSYMQKTGQPSLSQQLSDGMEKERQRYGKLLLWLRKSRASLSAIRHTLANHTDKVDEPFAKTALRHAHAEADRTLNTTGGPHALPEPFDILEYLRQNGRHI